MTESTDDMSGPLVNVGIPRNARAAAALARYDALAPIPLVLSALLPIVVAPQPGNPVSIVIGVVSWAVFVVDFVVHQRLLKRYLSTGLGKFDLAIVVFTAPWFLLPGAVSGGGLIVLLRLARLARLIVASKRARQLFNRIGRVAVVAVSVMTAGALVAYLAEHPVNPEFATFGDSLWWSVVTLTTVGYGDIVPETTTGRVAAVMIMLMGVAVLGLLAGTLASFFRLQPAAGSAQAAVPAPVNSADAAPGSAAAAADRGGSANPGETAARPAPAGMDLVLAELTALRAQVAELADLKIHLAALTEGSGQRTPPDPPAHASSL